MTQEEALKVVQERWGRAAFAELITRDGVPTYEVGVMSASGLTRYVRNVGPSWEEALFLDPPTGQKT